MLGVKAYVMFILTNILDGLSTPLHSYILICEIRCSTSNWITYRIIYWHIYATVSYAKYDVLHLIRLLIGLFTGISMQLCLMRNMMFYI
jgi:hypothetical protein